MALLDVIPCVTGGLMISSAITLNHRFGKRTTDPSSSLYSMLTLDSYSQWRSSFVAGMIFAATFMAFLFGFGDVKSPHMHAFERNSLFFKGTGLIQFMIAGFMIGAGSRLAGGGLTKYAFYGIPKFNRKSLVLTGTVLFFGMIVATIRSDFPILQGLNVTKKFNEHLDFRLSFVIPLVVLGINLARHYNNRQSVIDILSSFGIGALLGTGMLIAGLAKRHQVLDFLSFNKNWNPSLIFVFLGALLGNTFLLNYLSAGRFTTIEDEPTTKLGVREIIGSSLFGIGLGITGLTPGSGLLVSAVYLPQIVLFFLPFVVLGQLSINYVNRFITTADKTIKIQ